MHSSWWFPFMDLHIFTENHYIDDLPYWGEVIPHSAKPPHTAHEPTAARINRQKTNSWRMCLSSSAAIAPAQDPFMRVRQRAGRKVSMWEVFNDTLPNGAVKRCLTKIESDIQYQVPWKLIQEVYRTTARNEHPQRTSGDAQVLIVLPPIAHVDTILKPCRKCEKVKHDHGGKNWTSQLMYSSASSIKYRLSHSQHTKSVATVYFWSISSVKKTGFSWGENLFCVIIQKDEIGWQRQATKKCSTTPKNDTRNIQKKLKEHRTFIIASKWYC